MNEGMWAHGGRWLLILVALSVIDCKRLTNLADSGMARRAEPKLQASDIGKLLPKDWPLQSEVFRFRFALYLKEAPALDLERELQAATQGTSLSTVSKLPDPDQVPPGSLIALHLPKLEDFAPPDAESMKYRGKGLSAEEQEQLPKSHFVAVFELVGPGARAAKDYRQGLEVGKALASKLGGILWDDDTRGAYNLQSWQERLESWQGDVPKIQQHITIDAYREGELIRMVSLGMLKFGLPDLVVSQAAESDTRSLGNLMNAVMQRMVERRAVDAPGHIHLSLDEITNASAKKALDSNVFPNATRKLDVELLLAKPDKGDAENRLLELRFPGEGGEQERQAAAVAALFGSNDSITHVRHDDQMLELSARARKKAFGYRARYAKGPPFGEHLSVKAPFETSSGGSEWMWVEVVKWNGNTITGILDNDPFEVPTLKAGARVEVPADKIFDYLLTRADGSEEGNETGKLMLAREKEPAK
jgi:uncharacterized protein YegJ (DUF2314 family)